jgi:hypothetical protein
VTTLPPLACPAIAPDPRYASFNIKLEREFDRSLAPTELAPQEMTRVFLNLFGNGFYATAKRQRDGAGPEFRPTLRVATRDSMTQSKCGCATTAPASRRRSGTNCSSPCHDKADRRRRRARSVDRLRHVTQQHGGTIEVDSRVGEFTEFTIRLPRSQ